MTNKPISRKSNVVVQELEREVLIYDLNINKAFCLNQTSALVYEFCNGKNSVAEISEQMRVKLKTPVSEDFVWLTLEELTKNNLLEESADYISPFTGMNRREVIRKVGLASMIALPVISSIIAPTAVNAQSQTGIGCLPSNVCIAAGTLLCPPGCAQILSGSSFSSTDGSCTGTEFTGETLDCPRIPIGTLSALNIRIL